MPLSSSTHLSKRKGEDFYLDQQFSWHSPDSPTSSLPVLFHAFLILDGHGGTDTALYTLEHLIPEFISCLNQLCLEKKEPTQSTSRFAFEIHHCQALTMAFHRVNEYCHSHFQKSGTTASLLVAVLEQEEEKEGRVVCTLANVGDSHVFGFHGGVGIRLSEDHRAGLNHRESKRLEGMVGCELSKKLDSRGPLRLFPGGLMVTRSLGDFEAGPYCSCEPAISRLCVPLHYRMVLASDGLWDTLSLKEVAKLVTKADVVTCSRQLNMQAAKREGKKFGDDITVTVVDFTSLQQEQHKEVVEAAELWMWREGVVPPEPGRVLLSLRSQEDTTKNGKEFTVGMQTMQGRVLAMEGDICRIECKTTKRRYWLPTRDLQPAPLPPDEIRFTHFCTGFSPVWTSADLEAYFSTVGLVEPGGVLKQNPSCPEERGFFFRFGDGDHDVVCCGLHVVDEYDMYVERTRVAFPEFYA